MRLSQMLFVTLRDDPADAEIPSHKLLVRAGFIRRIGSGIYSYLPLMWRVLQKVSQIVREEMNATGAQECLLPQLQPSELWKESGRWDTYTKAEGIMFALSDRQDRELGLGPTHEEVITTIAKEMIRSYRQLPVNLYQIQTKFRDEIRPRFGLMRGREFIMKDAYSFHADEESLKETYRDMDQAYRNMLRRCGLAFRAVEADSGAIGGSGSQEFMVLADAGEDEILYTEDGKYAANVEKAVSLPPSQIPRPSYLDLFTPGEKIETPNCKTIEDLAKFLNCSPMNILKTVLYEALYDNGKTVLFLVNIRGDQEINEVKLNNHLVSHAFYFQAKTLISLKISDELSQKGWATKPLPLGYISLDLEHDYIVKNENIHHEFICLIDEKALNFGYHFIKGANEVNYHQLSEEVQLMVRKRRPISFNISGHWIDLDIRKAKIGDRAVHDPSQTLQTARGIEAGHIFQLGTKYSQAMGATFTDEQGKEKPLVMGCYGVGVSRLAQSAVEQSYDKDGIIWPVAIAPYEVIIVIPNMSDEEQVKAAENLYQDLNNAGIEALLDDRNERAGVKFKDADLIGIPYRIVTGKSLKEGKVELVTRATKEAQMINLEVVVNTLKGWIETAKK